jgi:hypothetical protein
MANQRKHCHSRNQEGSEQQKNLRSGHGRKAARLCDLTFDMSGGKKAQPF